jgi:hypothetical protein
MTTAQSGAGIAALALLAACGGDTDFTITQDYHVSGAGISEARRVNLADEAGDAWDHRDKIKDVTLRSATATITAVNPGNTAPSGSVEGSVARPGQTPATVVDATGTIAVGTEVAGQNLGAASDVLKDALKGDGAIDLEVDAAPASGTADFEVRLVLEVRAEWSLF